MKIKLKEILGEDRARLLMGSLFSIAVSVFFLLFWLLKTTIHSEKDLYYVNGPFESYNVDNSGYGSELTFRIQNYPNTFQVEAEFSGLLKKKDFYKIPDGDTISIGIAAAKRKYLNNKSGNIFVYSIKTKNDVYLNSSQTIKRQRRVNLALPLVSAFFFLFGIGVLYYRKNCPELSSHGELS